ncbi:Transcription antitermination protein NusG [hydrothermal vent metagenome]|uniref:Transcription antitermination protein NusG n=1 Tax=hydrothermal vent metagenome TaxID=652676 RepID=A0A3B1D8Q7_9ZZZZ
MGSDFRSVLKGISMAEIDDQVTDDEQASVDSDSVDTSGTSVEEKKEEAVEEEVATIEEIEEEVAVEEGEREEWFVLKVASNREKTVYNSLLRRIKQEGLEEFFGEIVIPTEKVAETKGGKKRVTEVKLFPGYIMIHMVLNDDTWYLVRDTNGVGDFTGAAGRPLPMRDDEIAKMLQQEESVDEKEVRHKINMTVGETVKITDGPFEAFEGTVEAIDEEHGKVTVLVEIFGQSTPVELEHGQMEKV